MEDTLETITGRLMQTSAELFRLENDSVIQAVFTKNRPDSVVIKLCISDKNGKHFFFVKTYKVRDLDKEVLREKLIKEFNVLNLFNEHQNKHTLCSVIKPIACYPDLLTIITEEQKGETLNSIIRRYAILFPSVKTLSQLEKYSRLCGEWLNTFQIISQDVQTVPFDLDKTLKEICAKLEICIEKQFIGNDLGLRIKKFMDKMISQSKPDSMDISGMHSDFIPSNILIDDDRLVVLDFSDFRSGPVYRDPVTFLHALDNYLWNPFFIPKTIIKLKEQFLIGYGKCIKKYDIPMARILEVRETLGEMVNLSSTIRKCWFSSAAYKRANSRLTNRLIDITRNTEQDSYRICGINWDIRFKESYCP